MAEQAGEERWFQLYFQETREITLDLLRRAEAAAYKVLVVTLDSAIKLPSVTGSSSHPTGTGLGAILFGPSAVAPIGAVVLLFQALLLAHGPHQIVEAGIRWRHEQRRQAAEEEE